MSDEIRQHPNPFSQIAIEEAIADLPNDAKAAVVLYADADADRMRFGVIGRKGEHWTFMGNLEKDWSGPWSVHAEVRYVLR